MNLTHTKKALLISIALWGVLEGALFLFQASLSGNVAHSLEIHDEIATALTKSQHGISLIVGNSLAGEGLDAKLLEDAEFRLNTTVIKAVPDGSNIWDWLCILESTERSSDVGPTVVIIPFAWDQLADQASLDVNRSFSFLCGLAHIPTIRKFKDLNADVLLEVLATKLSAVFRLRNQIRNRLLRSSIPNFKTVTQDLNTATNQNGREQHAIDGGSGASPSFEAVSYIRRLDRFRETTFIFVAMPVLEPYELSSAHCDALIDERSFLVDLRFERDIEARHFGDAIHLNSVGRRILTEALISRIQSWEVSTADTPAASVQCVASLRLP